MTPEVHAPPSPSRPAQAAAAARPAVALLIADPRDGFLGEPTPLDRPLLGRPLLHWAMDRAAAVDSIDSLAILHRGDRPELPALVEHWRGPKPAHAIQHDHPDPYRAMRRVARLWAPHAWRGGLGGATCYDELLPADPWLQALDACRADSALLLGAHWPLIDPQLAQRLLNLHLQHPDALQLTFCQAPPGLAPIALGRKLIEQLHGTDATLGQLLGYVPTKPQPDPIGRDLCIQIPHAVRDAALRFIPDNPRARRLLEALARARGERLLTDDAPAIARAAIDLGDDFHLAQSTPQQFTLELTVRRDRSGPFTPQHHVALNRPDLSLDDARAVIDRLAESPGALLTLAGAGDPLLHPHWQSLVAHAKRAGIAAVALQTDLAGDEDQVDRLLEAEIDVVSVNLHADKAPTYARTMGPSEESGAFKRVIAHIERLINERNRRWQSSPRWPAGVPWIVPRLMKTSLTLSDLETFFDRWMHYTRHALVEPPFTGCGAVPAPPPDARFPQPRRLPCRQASGIRAAGGRMTILSDGRVPHCDEDWTGLSTVGDARRETIDTLWQRLLPSPTQAHRLTLCPGCADWHAQGLTPQPAPASACASA